jgi:hypothetical protein
LGSRRGGLGEGEKGAVAVGQFARGIGGFIQVPAGEGAERNGDVRQAETCGFVAVGTDLGY